MGEKMSKEAKSNKVTISIMMLVSIVLVLCFFDVCKKEKTFSSPKGQVWDIMGRPDKLEDSGAVSVEYELPECVIHYNFKPRGKSEYEEELGAELTPKLKKLMETDKNIEKLSITIFGPSTDTYGRYGWNPVLFFEFDRETFDSIDWRNFARKDLLEIVKNLTWYKKSMQGKRDSI
jgi:hypothetical protein